MREMYAFWKYDVCPYILYGRITKFLCNGRVEVKAYGKYSFLPMVIINGKPGRIACEKIKDLRLEYRKKQRALEIQMPKYKLAALKIIGLKP